MGGRGSGSHWRGSVRDTIEDYRSIDVRRWYREGLLMFGHSFDWEWQYNGEIVSTIKVTVEVGRVILGYRRQVDDDAWESVQTAVDLDTTPGTCGGYRLWFRCPSMDCGRRVAILYRTKQSYFACRHCQKLAYPSQREPTWDRVARRARKIRARLKWEPGILNKNGGKPKGMHWRTYERLRRNALYLSNRSLQLIMQRWDGYRI